MAVIAAVVAMATGTAGGEGGDADADGGDADADGGDAYAAKVFQSNLSGLDGSPW